MMDMLKNCRLCPRNCGVDRFDGETGACGAGASVKVARVSLHHWEEPCLSGNKGSGMVFFSNCSLKCVFCQNHKISGEGFGKEISNERLSRIFLELQLKGAENINLVTPGHYAPQIVLALKTARAEGLTLPVVYNSSGYENIETIRALKGHIDIYLPDLKYYNDKYSIKYSNAPDYFINASKVVEEMYSQAGKAIFDEDMMMKRGVIIRHLMLPGLLFDSKKIVEYVYKTFNDNVFFSLMNQFTPMSQVSAYPEINRTISSKVYDSLVQYALNIGITNGFIQEEGTCSESFVPDFDLTGV
jgi:putative pyruvate formate lyase activating enzyme